MTYSLYPEKKLELYAVELARRSLGLVAVESIFCAIFILVAFFGNTIVLWIVYKNPSLRTIPNLFVISLAVSDVIMSGFCAPMCLAILITGRDVLGDALCNLQGFLVTILARVSLWTMGLVAINRFFLIVKPNMYRKIFKASYTRWMVIAVWVLSCAEPVPYLARGHRYFFHPAKVFCFPDSRMPAVIITGYIVVGIPMPILNYCYYKVFQAIRKHRRRLQGMRSNQPSMGGPSVEDINVTWTLFWTVCALLVCWTPISAIDIVDAARDTLASFPRPVYMLYLYLGQISTAVNPFIYGVMNKSFRDAYKRLFNRFRKSTRIMQVGGIQSHHQSDMKAKNSSAVTTVT
ncbi:melatonin receptor type 1A [Nematostella vectensis]|uniref:melatonin receptor type 1A n=1 Tax=Nematostella vectensis TaxID=45351 RepID=UPI0020775594|nr:melatonin receptor type 1A [Nematostella vectensis]